MSQDNVIKYYVIVGRSDSIPDSPWVTLHAGELRSGGMDEVVMQIERNPESCTGKYFSKNPKNDIYHPKVVPFSELEKEVRDN